MRRCFDMFLLNNYPLKPLHFFSHVHQQYVAYGIQYVRHRTIIRTCNMLHLNQAHTNSLEHDDEHYYVCVYLEIERSLHEKDLFRNHLYPACLKDDVA